MKEPTELPRAQRKVLEAILNTAEPDKLVPTQEELARTLGLTSKANVRRVLEELETKKLIATTRTSKGRALARSFKPTQKAWEWWKSQGNDLPEFMQTVIPETSDVVAKETNTPIAENDFAPQIKSLGEVAAGTPTLAEENTSDPVRVMQNSP
jgi:SOS-response transcriptional repressor LexA